MDRKKLILIFGGKSAEYEVSLTSCFNVLTSVDKEAFETVTVGITREGVWYIYSGSPDKIKDGTWCDDSALLDRLGGIPDGGFVSESGRRFGKEWIVFPVVHGTFCEDGRLQGFLDTCGVKYVGCGTATSAVCMDKYLTKLVISHRKIPQAAFMLVHKGMFADEQKIINKCETKFEYPVFVKPANAGSSVGASKVRCREELISAVKNAALHDDKVLIEEFIVGAEVEVAVMGNADAFASVPGEICPGSEFYDYETKYHSDTASYHIPARISDAASEKITEYAIRIYKALGCRGFARVDFFVTEDEKIIFNEINTLPGFTPISMYPRLMQYGGMEYGRITEKLVELADQE